MIGMGEKTDKIKIKTMRDPALANIRSNVADDITAQAIADANGVKKETLARERDRQHYIKESQRHREYYKGEIERERSRAVKAEMEARKLSEWILANKPRLMDLKRGKSEAICNSFLGQFLAILGGICLSAQGFQSKWLILRSEEARHAVGVALIVVGFILSAIGRAAFLAIWHFVPTMRKAEIKPAPPHKESL